MREAKPLRQLTKQELEDHIQFLAERSSVWGTPMMDLSAVDLLVETDAQGRETVIYQLRGSSR